MFTLGKIPAGYGESDAERQFIEDNPQKQKNRNTFEIDKGRIVHSSSFRRLQGKTEVLGVGERDFYRTRLTHSLEVAQVARGICKEVENPKDFTIDVDLVETIALAHDIGHPPFGHVGEEHLHKLMWEYGGFGANPQNIRIVTFVETKRASGGLNLTRAAIDGLIKYPELFDPEKFVEADGTRKKPQFTYLDDSELKDWVKQGVKHPDWKPVEGQIADWADTCVYSVNDLEDNFRAGLIDFLEMKKRASEIAEYSKGKITTDEVSKVAEDCYKDLVVDPKTFRERKANLKRWTSTTINKLLTGCTFVPRDVSEASNRYKYGFEVPPENKKLAKLLTNAAVVLCFKDPRVLTLEHKGVHILGALFEALVKDPRLLPRDFQEHLPKDADKRMTSRIVTDFLSGMTDSYAVTYYSRMFQPGEGSFYEDI